MRETLTSLGRSIGDILNAELRCCEWLEVADDLDAESSWLTAKERDSSSEQNPSWISCLAMQKYNGITASDEYEFIGLCSDHAELR